MTGSVFHILSLIRMTESKINSFTSYFFIAFIFLFSLKSIATPPLILTDDLEEKCLCREYVTYYEDISAHLNLSEIINLKSKNAFTVSTAADLINNNTSSTYWLNFNLKNKTDKPFRIELFDFDLDEVSLFIPDSTDKYIEYKAGYSYPFSFREVNHKNISFQISIPDGLTTNAYMRFKSNRHNVLEPIVRSYDKFLDYGFTEYILLGIFYGLMLLMIFYNFLYFTLLRKLYFLYYVLYGVGILLYLSAENGTGFQFIWPAYPEFNVYSSVIGLYVGISAMLFFTYRFLHLSITGSKKVKQFLVYAFIVRTLTFILQLIYPEGFRWELVDIILIQIVLFAGISRFQYRPAKWFIIAFIFLDVSFLISGLEGFDLIASNIVTVYSFNVGIILQFIFLSIAVGESIRETYKLKNEADAKLLQEYKKNDELKEKINRELEQLVRERTSALEDQNVKIEKQSEEIRGMYDNLELIVKKRTHELEEKNNRIRRYSFSNSHIVRAPLARILGLTDVARMENDISLELFELIRKNAKELDHVIREMNKILDENK